MNDIAYICDREACIDCTNDDCMHTTNIDHAKNFKCENGKYIEIVNTEVSEDCISREWVLNELSKMADDWVINNAVQHGIYEAHDFVEHAPSVAPTERTGEWKHTMTYYPYCSECEWLPEEDEMTHGHYNYCPNCGAKMKRIEK